MLRIATPFLEIMYRIESFWQFYLLFWEQIYSL